MDMAALFPRESDGGTASALWKDSKKSLQWEGMPGSVPSFYIMMYVFYFPNP